MSMTLTQENRILSINTPLGADTLLLTGFTGSEGISMPFSFELSLASEDTNINPRDIIGQGVTISIGLADDERRSINGIVCRFSQERLGEGSDQLLHVATYSATVVPWLWVLTRTLNSRIFQEKTVQQIIEQIFSEKEFPDYEFRLSGQYEPREYCVQYHESDFNFISRLLEQEGIFYFFEHEDGRHVLVLADSADEHKNCPHQDTVRCQQTGDTTVETEDVITNLGWGEEIRFGKYTTKDFNYLMPGTDLRVEMPTRISHARGEREFYDFPGAYKTRAEGERYADIRMQAEEVQITAMNGSSRCRAFVSGYKFTLTEYHRDDMNDTPYVLTVVNHSASEPIAGSGEESGMKYSNSFVCIPHKIPYRPPLMTNKPVIVGVQTAIVTGPSGEEIYTDEHGRVKVQFHWDREGQNNETTSCMVRVGQIWAGQGWGGIWIPRIGHEVIVSFIEGDPDRPLITGCVYNAQMTPPYKLPDNATQSGVKSRSSKGGTAENYNEIRFEDKKGAEQIQVHAEMNMDTSIEADETHDVGGNRKVHVQGNFDEHINGSETRTVDGGATETIHAGMTQHIDGGETRTVDGGITETVSGGETRTVTGGLTETVNGSETRTVTGSHDETITGSLTQTVTGGMTINSPAGITINAPAGYTVVAPGGTNTVDSWFTKIGGKDEDLFAIQTAILTMQTTIAGMSIAMQSGKVDLSGFVFERTFAKSANEPLSLKQGGIKLINGVANVLDFGLTMIGL
jgi:type VI secretion system secreted protein VgrG